MTRTRIPSATRSAVLLEAAYKCANPVCRHVLTLELHHIVWVKDKGGNAPENLLALCPNCHSLHTAGHIPADAIVIWKGSLVSLNNPHRGAADFLLVLYAEEERVRQQVITNPDKPAESRFRFSGDSLSFLSGLIASGLIEFDRSFSGTSWFGGGQPSFTVRLTPRGQALVTAWRASGAQSRSAT